MPKEEEWLDQLAVLPAQRLKIGRSFRTQDKLRLSMLLPQSGAGQTAACPALLMTSRLERGTYGKFHVAVSDSGAAFAVKQVRFLPREQVDKARGKAARLAYTSIQTFQREAAFLHQGSARLPLHALCATEDFCGFLVTDLMAGDLDGCMFFLRRNFLPAADQALACGVADQSRLVYPLAIAARVMHDIGEQMVGLAAAGIGHQDIKGKNLLVSPAPHRIILADFGFASRLTAKGHVRQTHPGTYAFASPEIMLGRSYDFSCDVWSLGVTLVEVLTGASLFDLDAYPGSYAGAKVSRFDLTLKLHAMYRIWHCDLERIDKISGDEPTPSAYQKDEFLSHLSNVHRALAPYAGLRAFIFGQMMHPYPKLRPGFLQAKEYAAKLLLRQDLLDKSLADHAQEALGRYATRNSKASRSVDHLRKVQERIVPFDEQGLSDGGLLAAPRGRQPARREGRRSSRSCR